MEKRSSKNYILFVLIELSRIEIEVVKEAPENGKTVLIELSRIEIRL